MGLSEQLSGAGVLVLEHAAGSFFSAGGGVMVTRRFGVLLRATWWPLGMTGRWRPKLGLEVPLLFDTTTEVGIGGVAGIEVGLSRQAAIGIELPVYWFFAGPANGETTYAFGGLTLGLGF